MIFHQAAAAVACSLRETYTGGRQAAGLRPCPLRGARQPSTSVNLSAEFGRLVLARSGVLIDNADMTKHASAIHDLSPSRLVLVIDGHPRPKQSFRWLRGRPVAVTKAMPLQAAWARAVLCAAQAARLERGGPLSAKGAPVRVSVEFRFPCRDRRRWGLVHVQRPDADNLCKLLGDELVRAGLLGDDAAIQWGRVVKVWAPPGAAGASVMLEIGAGVDAGARAKENPPGWLLPGGR